MEVRWKMHYEREVGWRMQYEWEEGNYNESLLN